MVTDLHQLVHSHTDHILGNDHGSFIGVLASGVGSEEGAVGELETNPETE